MWATSCEKLEPELLARPLTSYTEQENYFLLDCLSGLSSFPKTIPCKWLYDAEGSRLFDRICDLSEYYPARVETALLRMAACELAAFTHPGTTLAELGSGASIKTRIVLDAIPSIRRYVPIDICRYALAAASALIEDDYPDLEVIPLCADFTEPSALDLPAGPLLGFFPGSTLGNFAPDEAIQLLAVLRNALGAEGRLLLGVDLAKDASVLIPAYDDAQGVTAAFNRNLLHRMRRELGAEVDAEMFDHRAIWNEDASRIEMHLVARKSLAIGLAGQFFEMGQGQSIHTESSHKFGLETIQAMVAAAGWTVARQWISDDPQFLLVLLE